MKGKLKEIAGELSDNPKLEAEGTAEKIVGKVQEKIGQVKMALLLHRSTSALHTTVATKLGVVTMGGKARNTAEKGLVTKLVNDVNGVKSVKNRMTIE